MSGELESCVGQLARERGLGARKRPGLPFALGRYSDLRGRELSNGLPALNFISVALPMVNEGRFRALELFE